MGLDQNWYKTQTSDERTRALINDQNVNARTKFGYHRKNWELQIAMQDLWHKVTDCEGDMNCADFDVSDHLNEVSDIARGLKEEKDYLEIVIQEARIAVAEGRRIIYEPWW